MQHGDGVEEEAPPDEHLPEVVRVARVAPEAARDEAPAVLLLRPERRLLRVGDGLDEKPHEPEGHARDRPAAEARRVVPVEEVRDGQHDDGDRDRLQEPETREAQRLVPHPVEAVVDLDPHDPPEQVGAEPHRPHDDEQRGHELHRLGGAGDEQHDGEQGEGEAVGEVGDDVRPAGGRDGEEGAVDRQRDSEGEDDRGHGARTA